MMDSGTLYDKREIIHGGLIILAFKHREFSLVGSRGKDREEIQSPKRIWWAFAGFGNGGGPRRGQNSSFWELTASKERRSSVLQQQGAGSCQQLEWVWKQILSQSLQISAHAGWHLDFLAEDPASCFQTPSPQVEECYVSCWVCGRLSCKNRECIHIYSPLRLVSFTYIEVHLCCSRYQRFIHFYLFY